MPHLRYLTGFWKCLWAGTSKVGNDEVYLRNVKLVFLQLSVEMTKERSTQNGQYEQEPRRTTVHKNVIIY